jgi:methyl-accepting chemotaxis protein
MSKFLVIDSTLPDYRTIQTQCFTETTLNGATPDGNIFTKFQSTDKTYVCGGFTFNDINNQKVGTIVVIEDVTTLENTANRNNMTVLIIAILAAILLSALMVFIVSKIIIAPLEKIVEVSTRVAGGDFDVQIDIHTNDEIGQLAGTIEMFKEIMVNTAKDLEKAEEKK